MHDDHFDPHAPLQASTGFAAAGVDFRDKRLNLNDLVIRNPASTFFLKAETDVPLGGYIHAGDILVVDRAAAPSSGSLVIATVHGEMVLRMLQRKDGGWRLLSGERGAAASAEADFELWGTVTYVLHPVAG
jgi:DNA polymerase V